MLITALALFVVAPAASAKLPTGGPEGDGGLDVSGGTGGYVGGSGSISGSVKGPGVPPRATAPREAVTQDAPSAVDGGVVADANIPVVAKPDARPVNASGFGAGMLLVVVMTATLGTVVFMTRGLPRLN